VYGRVNAGSNVNEGMRTGERTTSLLHRSRGSSPLVNGHFRVKSSHIKEMFGYGGEYRDVSLEPQFVMTAAADL
jgi:hypothetical protein